MPNTRRTPAAPPPDAWPTIVDRWLRDPAIRKFSLIVLAMVLFAALLAAVIIGGMLPAIIGFAVAHLPATLLTGTGIVGGVGAGVAVNRRKARRRAASITPPASTAPPSAPTG